MTSAPRPPYPKPWLSYAHQVALLVSRGLTVADPAAAAQFLSHVNYYRFSGYCLAFEQPHHEFRPGVTFEDISAAYAFDVALRDLLTEALEIIEVDVRTTFAYHFGQQHGAFGHTKPVNFFQKFDHADLIRRLHEEADRSSELFIKHFRRCYLEYPDLPIWMLTEVVSFGTLVRMFRGMQRHDQQAVATRYGMQATFFGPILLHLVYVRNLCAHHSRLWDRIWSVKATLPRGPMWQPPLLPQNERLFSTLCLTQHLLKRCPLIGSFGAEWRDRLHQLLRNPPNSADALNCMGIPPNWEQHPVWK
ncbi:Abi family protein [Planctomicrobium sp. SH527]|uniref:Abi family protein n=1 Tax=Planctomicrobium sp. SH527 TaxID=3448123 RepID=UPI003F5B5826